MTDTRKSDAPGGRSRLPVDRPLCPAHGGCRSVSPGSGRHAAERIRPMADRDDPARARRRDRRCGPHWSRTASAWSAFRSRQRPRRARRDPLASPAGACARAGDAAEATAVEDVSMPQLAFEAPRLELHDPAKPKQSNGVVLCAAITNSQVRDGAGGKARSAEPRITWATPVGADVHGPIDGRWQASPRRRRSTSCRTDSRICSSSHSSFPGRSSSASLVASARTGCRTDAPT